MWVESVLGTLSDCPEAIGERLPLHTCPLTVHVTACEGQLTVPPEHVTLVAPDQPVLVQVNVAFPVAPVVPASAPAVPSAAATDVFTSAAKRLAAHVFEPTVQVLPPAGHAGVAPVTGPQLLLITAIVPLLQLAVALPW